MADPMEATVTIETAEVITETVEVPQEVGEHETIVTDVGEVVENVETVEHVEDVETVEDMEDVEAVETLETSTAATFMAETASVMLKDVAAQRQSFFSEILANEFEEPKFADVTFVCSDGKVIAHRIVLAAVSPLFREVLEDYRPDDEVVISLPDVSSVDLIGLLRPTYFGGDEEMKVDDNVEFLAFGVSDDDYYNMRVESAKNKVLVREPGKPVQRTSLIWNYFHEIDNENASCVQCDLIVSIKMGKTSGMTKHLRTLHPDSFMQLTKVPKTKFIPAAFNPAVSLLPETPLPSFKRKKSAVWKYFKLSDADENTVECLSCFRSYVIKEGKTSGLIRHLQVTHPALYDQMQNERSSRNVPLESIPMDGIKTDDELPEADVEMREGEDGSVNTLPKGRSKVWLYFDLESDDTTCTCKLCGKSFKIKANRTSNMTRHLRVYHYDEYATCVGDSVKREDEEDDDDLSLLRPSQVKTEIGIEERLGGLPTSRKRSNIWMHFQLGEDGCTCTCRLCFQAIQCKNQRTSNMIRHLQRSHFDYYEKFAKDSGLKIKPFEPKKLRSMKKEKKNIENDESSIHEDPASKTCDQCNKVYSSKRAMLYHKQVVHSGLKPFTCDECGMSFARQASFKNHTHSTEKTEICSVCGKMFVTRNARARHERTHFGEKKMQCSFCDRRFLTTQQRMNHELVHTGVKNFRCEDCGKCFARAHQLKNHTRVHTGERPYGCKHCGQNFKHLSSRNNHKCTRVLMPMDMPTIGTINAAAVARKQPQTIKYTTTATIVRRPEEYQ